MKVTFDSNTLYLDGGDDIIIKKKYDSSGLNLQGFYSDGSPRWDVQNFTILGGRRKKDKVRLLMISLGYKKWFSKLITFFI